LDAYLFEFRRVAAHDFDMACGDSEGAREDSKQFFIGPAVNRRRCDAHAQGSVMNARDGAA
jgi:hypothetical protein